MLLYVFMSRTDWKIRAFSPDATGASLPAEYGPWLRDSGGNTVTIDPASVPCQRADGVYPNGVMTTQGDGERT
jgi:hypothetical protein